MKFRQPPLSWALVVLGAILFALGWAGPANADPPGNNGTIKVDGTDFDSNPNNEPHVGCTFQIDFYGYETNIPVSMVFEVQPPTGNAVIHTETGTLDNDDATGGASAAGLDGEFTIDLSGALANYEPQPNQGYHVKLTITADDGNPNGAQVKQKVFWVTDCGSTTTTTEPTTTTTEATTTTAATSTTLATTTTAATSTTLPTTTTAATTTAASTTTAGASQPANVPASTDAPVVLGEVVLPRTGFSGTLLALGTALIIAGLAVELVRRGTRGRVVR